MHLGSSQIVSWLVQDGRAAVGLGSTGLDPRLQTLKWKAPMLRRWDHFLLLGIPPKATREKVKTKCK